jgi:reverse transcriptase-like protein
MSYSRKSGKRGKDSFARQYVLDKSPFHALERRVDLARLLRMGTEKVAELIDTREQLYVVRDDDSSGKMRTLCIPIKEMRRCHQHIFRLLKRIAIPDYIRSPRKKSTAWGNAALHRGGEFVTSFDIQAFYPSTSEEHIFRFFRHRLQMSDDCARQLALICTFRGYLPLGSPMSPHLACLVHLDIFEHAASMAAASSNTISVWVDDIALSGPAPRRDILASIKKRAAAKGLKTHKMQRGGGSRGVELTGSYLKRGRVVAANSSHLKIRNLTAELVDETDPHQRYRILSRLAAMTRYQRTILRSCGGDTQRLDSRLCYYKREMTHLTRRLAVTEPRHGPIFEISIDDPAAPF